MLVRWLGGDSSPVKGGGDQGKAVGRKAVKVGKILGWCPGPLAGEKAQVEVGGGS